MVIRSSTLVTPGAAQAARSASCPSNSRPRVRTFETYRYHPSCDGLIFFVYDPN